MRIFKVIKEYDRFYLCKSVKSGVRECFFKDEYSPNEGIISVPDEFEANRQWMLDYWEHRREVEKNDELSCIEKEI